MGQLAIKLLPMTSQAGYDRLLWSCDLNLVRGEDSFVRAQWAARPFLWHIYPQDDQAHIAKLDDFLGHYLGRCPPMAASGCAPSTMPSTMGKMCANSGPNGRNSVLFGNNMREAGHRSCLPMGISSLGW